MIPALMGMLLTLICGFLPALNVVSEKEVGTIEQINVTPVPKFTFILAKLLPYWITGFIVLTLCFLLAWLLYGITPVGHFIVIYFLAILFVFVMSGFGLVISNYSATMQQSMFVMFFFMLILMLMSGLFTPVSSMPEWAQVITYFNPLKYFMEGMRMVYLKGSSLLELLPEIGVLLLFCTGFQYLGGDQLSEKSIIENLIYKKQLLSLLVGKELFLLLFSPLGMNRGYCIILLRFAFRPSSLLLQKS